MRAAAAEYMRLPAAAWIIIVVSRPCCTNCVCALTHLAQSSGRHILAYAKGYTTILHFKPG